MNSFRDAVTGRRSGPVMPAKQSRQDAAGDDLTSVTVPRSESRTHNQRAESRQMSALGEARLFVKRKAYVADLMNLSGGGAMVRTNVPLKLWDKVHLELAEGDKVECAVRWIKNDRVGLEFAHETQVGGDAAKRDAMLLDTINRSFPECAPTADDNAVADERPDARTEAQRRAGMRHPLIWSGQILFDFESSRARLRNISDHGAMVECPRPIPEGSEVLLDIGAGGQHFANVSWVCGDQMGLRFQQPFDIACLSQTKPEVAPQSWSRPADLSAEQDRESPWAEDWEHMSLPELRETLEGFLKR